MNQINSISCSNLLKADTGTLFLLDVREKRELQNGTIKNALNIPLNTLKNNLHLIPKDKEIIVFCQIGMRGKTATKFLINSGFKARNLEGGYSRYQLLLSGEKNEI